MEIANKVGATEIVVKVVDDLKDENEAYRRMVMETIEKVVEAQGTHPMLQIDVLFVVNGECACDDN